MSSRTPEHQLNQVISVQRASTARDPLGGLTTQWTTVLSAVSAAVQERRASNREDAWRQPPRAWVQVFVGPEQDIRPGDRLSWRQRIFHIVRCRDLAGAQRLLMLEAQEVTS